MGGEAGRRAGGRREARRRREKEEKGGPHGGRGGKRERKGRTRDRVEEDHGRVSLLPSLEEGVSGHTRRHTQLPLGEPELVRSPGLDVSRETGKCVPAYVCVFVRVHPR